MRKPVLDYRDFRLSKINDPQFSHLKLLLGWVGYFILYFLTENLIPAEKCHTIYSPIDDLIPFNEYFIIIYVFWYFWIIYSLGYFLLYNIENFKRLQGYIIITQIIAVIIYILYPSIQNLRPEKFETNNIFTYIVSNIYTLDTPTGVCPSLHCAYSIAIASVWMREKSKSIFSKVLSWCLALLVCVSTLFVKQHSIVDFFVAIPVCVFAEFVVFYVIPKIKSKRKQI